MFLMTLFISTHCDEQGFVSKYLCYKWQLGAKGKLCAGEKITFTIVATLLGDFYSGIRFTLGYNYSNFCTLVQKPGQL